MRDKHKKYVSNHMIKKENHNRNIIIPVHLYILLENNTLYLRNAFPFVFLKCHSATGMVCIFCVYFHRSLMLALLGYVDAEVIVDHFYDRVIHIGILHTQHGI